MSHPVNGTDTPSEKSSPKLNGSSDGLPTLADTDTKPKAYVRQNAGVSKIEALYVVFGKGWMLWMLWISIGLVAYVYSLQASTTGVYLQYATSTFGYHSLLGTVSTINMLVSAVMKPVYARIADMTSRPAVLTSGLFFYVIGYIVVAASQSVQDLAGGEVLYTIGNTGLSFAKSLIVADITSLQNRGLVQGLITSPFIPNGFIAGFITDGIGGLRGEGWRWGYGMFIIMTPILMAPAIVVLYWGQRRAKQLGALAVIDQEEARRNVAQQSTERPTIRAIIVGLFWQVDIIGLLLLAFGLGCFLVPFSLAANADGGYSNPSMIALLVVGFVLLIATGIYEKKYASFPIMPRRIANRALICACAIDAFYWMSYYTNGIYFNSWVFVITDWSDRDYTFWANALNTSMCITGVVSGLIMRYTHNYKWPTLFGLVVRSTGTALSFAATYNPRESLLIMSPILVGLGAAFSTIGTMVGVQASVPHADLAIAAAVLSLITSIGGSCGGAIGASIWTEKLPAALSAIPGLNATMVADIYGDIRVARAAEPRRQVIQAYLDTAWYLELPALLIGLLPIIFGLLTTNFYLGDTQNAIETDKKVVMQDASETTDERIREKVREAEEKAKTQVAGKAAAAA